MTIQSASDHYAPKLCFEDHLVSRSADIEAWFREQWIETPPPFYCSVDLRNAGFKLAPVDTNLFPGGFNNLNPELESLCIPAIQSAVERAHPTCRGVLLIPENHTRNRFYLENVATLVDLIRKSGFHVQVGSLSADIRESTTLDLDISGRQLTLEPLTRDGDMVRVGNSTSCVVLLNNDLTAGSPEILQGIRQAIAPPLGAGWHKRLKTQHFGFYRDAAEDFGKVAGIDPWLLAPMFRNCGDINFMKREGEDCLISNVELLIEDIREKYAEYGIKQDPFVIIKADAGTYGMGVMTARSADDVREMNRKARTRMASAKEGANVTGAIIQEGVYTLETWGPGKHTAEPVVYMIDRFVVGGFYRVNEKRGTQENLNAPGMSFKPLPFSVPGNHPDLSAPTDAESNQYYSYGIVARIAMVAAAREISAINRAASNGQGKSP